MFPWKVFCAIVLVTVFFMLFTTFTWNPDIGLLYVNSPFYQLFSNDPVINFDPKINKMLLEELDIESLKFLLHGMLTRKVMACKKTKQFGGKFRHGGYEVCVDGPLRPVPGDCTVLSFGIDNEWSFDEALANQTCMVNSYDPSMGMGDHLHKKNVQFYNIGLGKVNEVNSKGWKMKNIMTILGDLGKTDQVIDVIKCDAEGAEWPFLEDLALNKIKVKQVILEIHSPKTIPERVTKEDFVYMINVFHQLRRSKYHVWHSHHLLNCCHVYSPMMPPVVTEKCCYEIYIYNSRYL